MAGVKKTKENAEAAQAAQEAAQNAPGAAVGTDTTQEPEAAQAAQEAAQTAENEPETAEVEKLVYVGPQLPRGLLKTNTIFEGTREQILASPEMEAVLKKYPLVKNMLVPVSKLAEAKVKIKTAGNALHKFYADIDSLAAADVMEG